MDKYIKRLQTRVSRKGISVTKQQVREVYTEVVSSPESPTEDEMASVIERLETQFQAPSYQAGTTDKQLTVVEPSTPVEQEQAITEQPSLSQQEEPQEMTQPTPAQPAQELTESALTTSSPSTLSHGSSINLGITQQQIQDAVEQQFGKENVETKTAILNYVAQDTFSTAQELQQALLSLRQMKLDILMKLISDHNKESASDEDLLKTALMNATASRREETEVFFAGFETQLSQMRAAFGI